MGAFSIPLTIWLVVAIICYVILRYTKFGQYVYAVGGNEKVAHLSGVNVDRIKILSAVACGILAALGGIVLVFRVMSALPQAATMYELYAIASAVLGGCSLKGGIGNVLLSASFCWELSSTDCTWLAFLPTGNRQLPV